MSERILPERANDEIRRLRKDVDALLYGSSSLRSASISEGGLRLKDGGSLRIEGGDLVIYDDEGTEVFRANATGLDLAGKLSVGGSVVVGEGGAISSGDFDGEDLDTPGTDGWWLGPEGIVVNRAVIRTGFRVVTGRRETTAALVGSSGAIVYTTVTDVDIDVPDWATTCQALAFIAGTAGYSADSTEEGAFLSRIEIVGGDSAVDPEVGSIITNRLRPVPGGGDFKAVSNSHQRVSTNLPAQINVAAEGGYFDPDENTHTATLAIIVLCVFTDE